MPRRVVQDDDFFGRDNELYQVRERLLNGQSILIVGERRIGKSSLLAESHRRLSRSAPKCHLYLDAQSFSTGGRLLASLAAYLADQMLPEARVGRNDDAELDALNRALKQASDVGRRLTIYVNDIDDLLARSPELEDGRHLVSFLRSVIENGHTIVCGVAFRPMLVEPPTPMHAPLFNVFYPLTLRTFDEPDAWHLLTTNSKRSGSELAEPECHFIMELAGRKPYHLQEFGYALFESGSFLNSIGSERQKLLEEAANSFAWAMQEHWVHTLSNLSAPQRLALINALRGEPRYDPGSYSYLVKRGLLDEGLSQFTPMGTLFQAFALDVASEPQDEEPRGHLMAGMKNVAESAMHAAVGAAVKAILS